MQCSVTLAREHDYGHVKMKNYNNYKNSYKKDNNVDIKQLCQRIQELRAGMPSCSIEQAEAIRRYYEAFPALEKSRPAPPPPPPAPAWRRNMPPPPAPRRPHHPRRHSHPPKKQRKNKQALPEWMHHEGVWDMEAHDPVKEFIRAIALDEGYGTGDRAPPRLGDKLPEWDIDKVPADWALADELEPAPLTPLDASLYEQFAAKFDRSLAALWDAPDELAELPVDLDLLLASPSDQPAAGLPERLQPLRLDAAPLDLLVDDEACVAAVADTLRSLTAINHSREASGFAEVPPRRPRAPAPPPPPPRAPPAPREDLLTAACTHFRPIRREPDADAAPRYADGDTFDIRGSLEPADFRASPGGHRYLHGRLYLEYRTRAIDYDRLRLTAAQRCPDLDDDGFRLRFPLRQTDAGVQTEPCEWPAAGPAAPSEDELSSVELSEDEPAPGGSPPDRKRRHSAARAACPHPHARFLHCCVGDRPLTR